MLRIGEEFIDIVDPRGCERMMRSLPSLFFFIPFKHREVRNPQELVCFFLRQPVELMRQPDPQRAQGCLSHMRLVSHDQHQIIIGDRQFLDQCLLFGIADGLDDGTGQFALFHLQPGKGLGPEVMLDEFLQFIELLAAVSGSGMIKFHGIHFTIAVEHGSEDREVRIREDLPDVLDFIAVAQVRLVGTIALHALIPGHADKVVFHLVAADFHEDCLHQFFNYGEDIVFINETHFDVNLGEGRLTVSPQVFIPEASGNLEILFHTADHQQLLVDLRGLRQGPEFAVVQTGRHQVVSCAFRCGTGQDRGFHFDKAHAVQGLAGNHADLVTGHQDLLQGRPAQIQVSVLQAGIFQRIRIIGNHDRRRGGRVDDFHCFGMHFDLAGFHLRIRFFSFHDCTGYLQDIFASDILDGITQGLIKDDLNETGAVPQIDEYQGTEVPAPLHPADQRYFFPGIRQPQRAVSACSFHMFYSSSHFVISSAISAAGTVTCALSFGRLTFTVPAAHSSSPIMMIYFAPLRSALLNCALRERGMKFVSAV